VSYVTNGRTTSREEILLEVQYCLCLSSCFNLCWFFQCMDCLLGYKSQGDLKLKTCHTINEHLIHLSKEKVSNTVGCYGDIKLPFTQKYF